MASDEAVEPLSEAAQQAVITKLIEGRSHMVFVKAMAEEGAYHSHSRGSVALRKLAEAVQLVEQRDTLETSPKKMLLQNKERVLAFLRPLKEQGYVHFYESANGVGIAITDEGMRRYSNFGPENAQRASETGESINTSERPVSFSVDQLQRIQTAMGGLHLPDQLDEFLRRLTNPEVEGQREV